MPLIRYIVSPTDNPIDDYTFSRIDGMDEEGFIKTIFTTLGAKKIYRVDTKQIWEMGSNGQTTCRAEE